MTSQAENLETQTHRMCVSCRQVSAKTRLMRFVLSREGELVFDPNARAEGKGAWACSTFDCVSNALKKKAFSRAFKCAVKVNESSFLEDIERTLENIVLTNLGLAWRARQCEIGRLRAMDDVENEKSAFIILAHDLSNRSKEECRNAKAFAGIQFLDGPSKMRIGKAISREETGVVALRKGRISDRVITDLERLSSFGVYDRQKQFEESLDG